MITGRTVLAALIGTIGVMMQGSALAGEPIVMTRSEAYAAARIDTAFDLVAVMPARAAVMLPMAQKGDLLIPPGCADMAGDVQGECMDVAYEIESVPSIVVETRNGTTSTLLRLDPFTLADVANELQ
jgi:hypothetical protein